MRGEKLSSMVMQTLRIGSSPHARGKVTIIAYTNAQDRIIPACAGKSWIFKIYSSNKKDHPRMRGEKGYLK